MTGSSSTAVLTSRGLVLALSAGTLPEGLQQVEEAPTAAPVPRAEPTIHFHRVWKAFHEPCVCQASSAAVCAAFFLQG